MVVSELSGAAVKALLEAICDNLFNRDPYYQQRRDMARVGGLEYACAPREAIGRRMSDMTVRGKPLDPARRYKVASWAPVAEAASGEPVWDVVARELRRLRT